MSRGLVERTLLKHTTIVVALAFAVVLSRVAFDASRVQAISQTGRAVAGSVVALCGADEPGERLVFGGRVLDYRGRPLAKAAVIAYQTDRAGLYNPPGSPTRVPRLRGVAVTDEDGAFRFATIRPGPYPDGSEPAHIHIEAVAPAHRLRYVTYWFEGDPLITPERRRKLTTDAETVVVTLARGADGVWTFTRDVRLDGN